MTSPLKVFRSRYQLKQSELAERLGLSQGLISKFELGQEVSVATAMKIERVLGPECPAESLNPLLAEFVTLYLSRQS